MRRVLSVARSGARVRVLASASRVPVRYAGDAAEVKEPLNKMYTYGTQEESYNGEIPEEVELMGDQALTPDNLYQDVKFDARWCAKLLGVAFGALGAFGLLMAMWGGESRKPTTSRYEQLVSSPNFPSEETQE